MYELNTRNEYAKNLYREAENERLVRSVRNKDNSLVSNARKALGQGLVAVGHHLLNEKRR